MLMCEHECEPSTLRVTRCGRLCVLDTMAAIPCIVDLHPRDAFAAILLECTGVQVCWYAVDDDVLSLGFAFHIHAVVAIRAQCLEMLLL